MNSARQLPALGVLLTLVAAIALGVLVAVWMSSRTQATPGLPGVATAVQSSGVEARGCGKTTAPFADPNFIPVAGRFGPAADTYPAIVDSGEVIPEEVAGQMPGALLPPTFPEEWQQRLFVRDTSDRDADGNQESRLRVYLSPQPVQGTILDFSEAGGLLLVQAEAAGVDADFVAAEIADTGRRSSTIEIGPHSAIMYLADPVIRDDLRPWHMYWSDGTRDWSLQGVADPQAMVALARSLYC